MMDKEQQLQAIEDRAEALEGENHRLSEKIRENNSILWMLRSDKFKVKTGKAFGDTFKFEKHEYSIVNEYYVKKVNGQNELSCRGLEEFLLGQRESPFPVRKKKKLRFVGALR